VFLNAQSEITIVQTIENWIMAFCEWADYTWFGHGVRDSVWLFPFVEIFHLIGLGLLGGTILVLNLRLLNVDFRSEPTAELAKDVRPWMIGGMVTMLVSGFFLFSSESVKMYGNPGFRYKMLFLLLALIYTFTVYGRVIAADEAKIAPAWRRLAAVVSLFLWAGVGLAGRAIGYVGR
jgi:hypothetical protein